MQAQKGRGKNIQKKPAPESDQQAQNPVAFLKKVNQNDSQKNQIGIKREQAKMRQKTRLEKSQQIKSNN
jgi:hypothetical protein